MASDPECAIDLVLSDLVMPGTNGREVVERLQVLRPGLRSLFMSGYTSDAIVRRGIQTGGSPFIQKPFLPATLLAKVRQVLDAASPDAVAGSR
jgi:DNA-binding NarL/FixJ family response regulator